MAEHESTSDHSVANHDTADHQRMYHRLFHAVTEAAALLRQISQELERAQQDCEEIYLEGDSRG